MLSKAAVYVSYIALALLVLLVVTDASMRYLFSAGSVAMQELEWHLFDAVFLLSIAYVLQIDKHVRIDIFYEHYSEKKRKIVNLLTHIVFVIPFSLLVVYFSIDFVILSFIQDESSSDPGGLTYRFLVKSLLILSFVLLLIESLFQVRKQI